MRRSTETLGSSHGGVVSTRIMLGCWQPGWGRSTFSQANAGRVVGHVSTWEGRRSTSPASYAVSNTDLPSEGIGLFAGGSVLTIGGLVGTIITGRMLAQRKRKLRGLTEARYEGPRRVQWDLARSRFVF